MKPIRIRIFCGTLALSMTLGLLSGAARAQGAKPLRRCPPDSVVSGTVCIDKYEASIWRVPNAATANRTLIDTIQKGKATAADLNAGGATQLGISSHDYAPCADNGQSCSDVYAVSLPGVLPSQYVTWFQAVVACKNSRKRLPSNAEWQAAVTGTPDPGPDDGTTDCNSNTGMATLTGSRSTCVSDDGAFDMVGNLYEWVADWIPRSPGDTCGSWSSSVSSTGDDQCFNGAATSGEPGALLRGGDYFDSTLAGPLAIFGEAGPSLPQFVVAGFGFRCAR